MWKYIIGALVNYRNVVIEYIVSLWPLICESFSLLAVYTSHDLWDKLQFWLCYVKSSLLLDNNEKQKLLEWVKIKLSSNRRPSEAHRRLSECFQFSSTDFISCWQDGILFCALIDSIVPGSCPRYDLLNPDHELDNVKLALKLVEKKLGIKPEITEEEIINGTLHAEKKLACLLAQIRVASAKLKLIPVVNDDDVEEDDDVMFSTEQECIARGMGLMLAITGRKAHFNIYFKSFSNLNIVIEIKGPNDSLCSERITNRSPKRKDSLERENTEKSYRKIPFEYEVHPEKVTVNYIPIYGGQHRLSIIWQGQHIMGSPYFVNVDVTSAGHDVKLKKIKAMSFKDCHNKKVSHENRDVEHIHSKFGTVIKKRVLRHIMVVNGKEVIIETDSKNVTESLAKVTQQKSSSVVDKDEDCIETNNTNTKSIEETMAAHYPTSQKTKTIISLPSLGTVLEGIAQPESELLFPTINSKRSKIFNYSNKQEHKNDITSKDLTVSSNSHLVLEECKNAYIKDTAETIMEDSNLIREIHLPNQFAQQSKETHSSEKDKDFIIQKPNKSYSEIDHSKKVFINETKMVRNTENKDLKRIHTKSTEDDNINTETFNSELYITEKSINAYQLAQDLSTYTSNQNVNKSFEITQTTKQLNSDLNSNDSNDYSTDISLERVNSSDLNELYYLPVVQTSKQNTYLTSMNSNVSTYDYQKESRTEHNTSTITSINSSPDKESDKQNQMMQQSLRRTSYQKLFNLTKNEDGLVRNKVKQWERAIGLNINNKTPHVENFETQSERSESPVLISVHSRKQFWENGCQSLQEFQDNPVHSVSKYSLDESDDNEREKTSDRFPIISSHSVENINSKVDKSIQVTQEDLCKKFKISSESFQDGTPDSEDSGISDSKRSLVLPTANYTSERSSDSLRRSQFKNRMAQESISSDTTDGLSVSTDWDRGFIDDEIPDYANLLLDNYISFTGLLDTEKPITMKELLKHDLILDKEEHFCKEPLVPKPERCKIFGTGVYYGQVYLRNHFQVRTRGAGPGYLTINVQGAGIHDVSETTVLYSGNDVYDVLYEVTQPGYYVITIKWGEMNIPESPFICKVTY